MVLAARAGLGEEAVRLAVGLEHALVQMPDLQDRDRSRGVGGRRRFGRGRVGRVGRPFGRCGLRCHAGRRGRDVFHVSVRLHVSMIGRERAGMRSAPTEPDRHSLPPAGWIGAKTRAEVAEMIDVVEDCGIRWSAVVERGADSFESGGSGFARGHLPEAGSSLTCRWAGSDVPGGVPTLPRSRRVG